MPLRTPSRTPRTLRRAGPLLVAAVVLMLLSPAHAASASGGDAGDYVNRINALRSSVGRAPLQVDGELTSIAQNWSAHMAATGTLSHSPDLSSGISSNWTKLGENVGTGPGNDAIWTAFVNSAHHYANIVDPDFNRVGVGVAYAGNGMQWTTQRFMQVSGGSGGGGGGSSPPPARSSTPKAKAGPSTTAAPTTTTSTAPPAPVTPPPPLPGPPPPADSARVAAVLSALHHLST
ncbi:MAG: CAP domain-containing protein [Acidimicrobiales bacterium]